MYVLIVSSQWILQPYYWEIELQDAYQEVNWAGKNYTAALGNFVPKMQKRALKIAIDYNVKACSMFIADLVNGMWKVAPENKTFIFCLKLRSSWDV